MNDFNGATANEHILALSWNIATDPKLYRELAPNPYSPKAVQIILERFPDANTADIIKAVVFAELEGRYDRNFRLLEAVKQEKELRKQRKIFKKINKRLVQYCKKHAKEFSSLPKEYVYEDLSRVVFGEDDFEKIEERYSQNQRRDYRLLIVDFIEDDRLPVNGNFGKKPIPRWILPEAIFAALSIILLFYFVKGQIQGNVQHQETKKQALGIQTQKSQELPVRLKIPSINVDAVIEYVGVTSKGVMEVPKNTIDAGWFKLGPRPGEMGSAVIAGHLDGENGGEAVFTNLYKLKKGDKLYVVNEKGEFSAFVVRESRIYNPGYADVVFSRNDGAYLNLITCDGVWDGNKKSYSKRLVVFADIE